MQKIIIITGANRGLGKALVDVALKDDDAFLVSVSRSIHEHHIGISKEKLSFIKTDLSEPFSNTFIKYLESILHPNTILYFINNASTIVPIKKIGTLNDMDISNSIAVNVQFPVSLINDLLKQFTKNKMILVNISSGAGINPISHWSLYGAAKAYIDMFFKVLEIENENNNFSFFTIDPGVINTGMQEYIREINFPKKDYFISLKEDNKLLRTEDAAQRIFNEINYYK